MIRPFKPDDLSRCEQILRGLPDWFGIEESIVKYIQDLQAMETWIVESGVDSDGDAVGFLTLKRHNPHTAEVHVIAVVESQHRKGLGRQLIEQAERILRDESVEFLQVKTLAPSHPDPFYKKTRGFYRHMGFIPLEENNLWGKDNPCLIMVKHLGHE